MCCAPWIFSREVARKGKRLLYCGRGRIIFRLLGGIAGVEGMLLASFLVLLAINGMCR